MTSREKTTQVFVLLNSFTVKYRTTAFAWSLKKQFHLFSYPAKITLS